MENSERSSTRVIVIGVLLFIALLLIIGATQIFSDEDEDNTEPGAWTTEIASPI